MPDTEKSRGKEHDDGKLELANAIRTDIFRNKMTIAEAARLINVAEPTLRTWLHRGQFPRYVIAQLAGFLGWEQSPDDLAKEYGIKEWARPRGAAGPDEDKVSLEQILEFQDQICEKINDPKEPDSVVSETTKGFCRCFEAMRDGDLFVFSSLSVPPLEFEREKWEPFGRSVAQAIGNGGMCLYLTPDQNIISRFTGGTKWNYDKMVTEKEFQAYWQGFRMNVVNYLMFKGASEKKANECVQDRLCHLKYTDSPFLSPGFAIGMFQTKARVSKRARTGRVVRRMTVRVPTDLGGVLFLPEEKEDVFTLRFWKFICKTVVQELETKGATKSLERINNMLNSEFQPG